LKGTGWAIRLLLFVAIAITAHLLLSRLGFSPTDDGFILAQSRRLLAGQVPHRDFISVRPVGSAALHTADLILGGGRTFLVSRLIYWIEAALICWCWLEITLRRVPGRLGFWDLAPLIPLAFMLSTHAFPPMAWHTVDGVWLASLGFLVCQNPARGWRLAGYFLVGAAVTCKQNFLPILPLAAVVNGDLRHPPAWLALAAPLLLYIIGLTALGAGADMRQQLFALTDLTSSGLKHYIAPLGWPTGLIIGAAAGAAIAFGAGSGERPPRSLGVWLGLLVLAAALTTIGWTLDAPRFLYIDRMCFTLLGCLCGFMLASVRTPALATMLPASTFLAVLAWCSGISLGYQTPAHVAGPMGIALLVPVRSHLGGDGRTGSRVAASLLLWIVVAVVWTHWWSARHDHIYNEATAPLLTQRLDDVFPGGAGIVTNANTHAVLSELHDVVAGLNGRSYAIVVDLPGWWAHSPQLNPLPTDWPQGIELCTEQLQARLSARALALRGRTVFIVQKVQMTTLADGLYRLDDGNLYYGAAAWIRRNFRKASEGRFWDVYE